MSAIVSAIVPVFLVAAMGYAVRKRCPLDTKTLTTLNLYLFIPCLVFDGLSRRELQWTVFGHFALGAIFMLLAMTAILGLIARGRALTGPARSAFMMTMFMNLGNFGLPVCLFAFGEDGLALAVVAMVCGSFLQNSVGIYFAQRTHFSVAQAARRVFWFPMIYAFALALLCQRTGLKLPVTLSRAIGITADAAIPVQLMILGIQLAQTRLETSVNVFLAAGVRLCIAPLLAAVFARLIGMEGLAAKVFIVQMSGPVAVAMAAYGVQFNVAPRFLASVVSWTFLLSLATVSAVLFVLDKVSL